MNPGNITTLCKQHIRKVSVVSGFKQASILVTEKIALHYQLKGSIKDDISGWAQHLKTSDLYI